MGCLEIAGRHVGSTDGPSIRVPGCYRSKNARGRLGCDAVPGVISEVDSQFANRVIGALAAKLDGTDVGRMLDLMLDANLITKAERDGVTGAINDVENGTSESEMAVDAMRRLFPHGDRLAHDNGRGSFHERFGTGRIKTDPYQGTPMGGGSPSATEFPNWHRLKA